MRHIGCYFPDADFTEAAAVGDFCIIAPQDLIANGDRLDAFARTNLRVMLQWHIGTQDALLNVGGQFTADLTQYRDALAARGLLDRVIAILPHEEWYLRLISGGLDQWPSVRALGDVVSRHRVIASALCGALDRLVPTIKAVFPSALVGHVEPFWNDDASDETLYRPVPKAYDFLGVDAYVHGQMTRARWLQNVDRAYAQTAKCGKPILMVPQTFSDQDGLWAQMPTPRQLAWWGELPAKYPLIQACAYFCLDHPHRTSKGLLQAPDRLALVRQYWSTRA
jgi:hypothetical protein